MYAKKNSGKKILAMALAVVLLIGVGVGGTLAWLQDSTETVTNTFTVGNIDIDLKEHELKADGTVDTAKEVTSEDDYKIIPGTSQSKDPFVRVKAGSESCWVFVKVEVSNNEVTINNEAVKYIDYAIDLKTSTEGEEGETVTTGVWTALGEGYPGIYYVKQDAVTGQNDVTLNILKDQKVSYPSTLTKAQINELYVKDAQNNVTMQVNADKQPQLKFTAYAIQSKGLKLNANDTVDITNAIDAWTVSGFGSST